MKLTGLLILSLSLLAACGGAPPRAEFEITVGGPSAANAAERDSTLGVLKSRIEKIAEGGFEFAPSGDGKYTLSLNTAFTDREVEFVLTSPGRLEFWEPCRWSRDLADILPWARKLQDEEETESNRGSKVLASYIPRSYSDSDPCALVGISAEAYPVVRAALDSLKAAGIIPDKTRFSRQIRKDAFEDGIYYAVYLLKCDPALNGPVMDNSFIEKLSYAAPSRTRYFPGVDITFNELGAKLWREITFENVGNHIAVSFDGEILMVPRVASPIEGGKITVEAGTESRGELGFILKCIPPIVGSGTLALPVGCRRI